MPFDISGDQNIGFPARLPKLGEVKDWWNYPQIRFWRWHLCNFMLHIQKVVPPATTPPLNSAQFLFLAKFPFVKNMKLSQNFKLYVDCCLLDLIGMLNSLDIQCQRRNISGIFLLVDGHWSVVSMRLDLALFQKWCKAGSGKWRLSGMSLHRARPREKTWHHECPQWGVLKKKTNTKWVFWVRNCDMIWWSIIGDFVNTQL